MYAQNRDSGCLWLPGQFQNAHGPFPPCHGVIHHITLTLVEVASREEVRHGGGLARWRDGLRKEALASSMAFVVVC